ncbi:MAG: sigma-70 family RNA polymerase sigma factor [Polyangia bacterium]
MRSSVLAPTVARGSDSSIEPGSVAPFPVERQPSAEEIALVAALNRGDAWAAQEVWDRHVSAVRRVIARAVGPRYDGDDLTQDVFMRVFSRIHLLRDAGKLREFVMAVTVNTIKVDLRRRWVRRWVLLSRDGTVPDVAVPGADPEAREALARCYAILDKLGARERTAFVLRYMEEQTLEEVAAGLGVSLSSAKRLVNRATERVNKHVGSDAGLHTFFDKRGQVANGHPGRAKTTQETTENKSTKTNVTE